MTPTEGPSREQRGPEHDDDNSRSVVLFGAALLLIGVVWLLDSVGLVSLQWRMLLPVALVVIGLALLATARRGSHGGLVAAGVVVSALVLAQIATPTASSLHGIGDRTHRPSTVADVHSPYRLGIGSLTVDLRDVDLGDGPLTVSADVGIGELVVRVPDGADVDVAARAAIGDTDIEGRSRGGVAVRADETIGSGPAELSLDLSVGIGQVTVTR